MNDPRNLDALRIEMAHVRDRIRYHKGNLDHLYIREQRIVHELADEEQRRGAEATRHSSRSET